MLSFLPDHALDSMLDARDLPVKEEADGMSAQLELGKQLGSMDRMDRINSFVFDDYAFILTERFLNERHIFFLRFLRSSWFKIQSPTSIIYQ